MKLSLKSINNIQLGDVVLLEGGTELCQICAIVGSGGQIRLDFTRIGEAFNESPSARFTRNKHTKILFFDAGLAQKVHADQLVKGDVISAGIHSNLKVVTGINHDLLSSESRIAVETTRSTFYFKPEVLVSKISPLLSKPSQLIWAHQVKVGQRVNVVNPGFGGTAVRGFVEKNQLATEGQESLLTLQVLGGNTRTLSVHSYLYVEVLPEILPPLRQDPPHGHRHIQLLW